MQRVVIILFYICYTRIHSYVQQNKIKVIEYLFSCNTKTIKALVVVR